MSGKPDLEAIEARANAATRGPWYTSSPYSVRREGTDELLISVAYDRRARAADAEFTAHARADVPALVERVRLLEELLTEAVDDAEQVTSTQCVASMTPELVARVREALGPVSERTDAGADATLDYAGTATPDDYFCCACGASGCKLWRESSSMVIRLRCCDCAAEVERKSVTDIDATGRVGVRGGYGMRTDQIGTHVPAVPAPDGNSYFGYSNVPDDACAWWRRLPTRPAGATSKAGDRRGS